MKLRTIINILFAASVSIVWGLGFSSTGAAVFMAQISYNLRMVTELTGGGLLRHSIMAIALFCLSGCVTALPSEGTVNEEYGVIAVGRVVAVITGQTKRMYDPAVRSFELFNRQTSQRFQIDVQSDDQQFALALPPGEYELSRVEINEGPFMSMAQLSAQFVLVERSITYLGTWRFGVDSPRYGRMVALSVVADEQGRQNAVNMIKTTYPMHEGEPLVTVLPNPTESETRLYEVMSYPRVPQYFRRHQW